MSVRLGRVDALRRGAVVCGGVRWCAVVCGGLSPLNAAPTRAGDDGRAVLVVVEHWNVHAPLALLLHEKALCAGETAAARGRQHARQAWPQRRVP